jgi:hypothetical protein
MERILVEQPIRFGARLTGPARGKLEAIERQFERESVGGDGRAYQALHEIMALEQRASRTDRQCRLSMP